MKMPQCFDTSGPEGSFTRRGKYVLFEDLCHRNLGQLRGLLVQCHVGRLWYEICHQFLQLWCNDIPSRMCIQEFL